MTGETIVSNLRVLPAPLPSAWHYWTAIKGQRDVPLRRDFDPVDIPELLPHLILTEVLRDAGAPESPDYRFRVIGTYVDERLQHRYTGLRLSEIEGKGPGSTVWTAYDEVRTDRAPKLRSLEYLGPMENLKRSRELYLPLSGDGEEVDFIVVALVFE